jgi:glycosyltransferase involved in cell wall biosynthesis
MKPSLPAVTIVMPVLNEAAWIGPSLEAVLGQDYPPELLEVLVVDGGSTDDTQTIVQKMIQNCSDVRLLDNPRRIRATGLNVGILAARGDIIVFVDGHTIIASDYVRECVRYLVEHKADNVGGGMRPVGLTYAGQGIALATTSPFGVGDSKFHYSAQEQYVDTVYLGAYWRKTFDQIGLYDETLHINADYELNYRLRKAGGKILLSPTIQSTYIPRASISALWRQYFRYVQGKVQTLQKHPESLRWRQAVSPLFVGVFVAALTGAFFWTPLRRLFALTAGCYLLANFVASTIGARRGGWRYGPVLPLIFATIHFAWGLGFWVGLIQAFFKPKQP